MSLNRAKQILQTYVGLKEKPAATKQKSHYTKPVFKRLGKVIFKQKTTQSEWFFFR